MNIFFKLTISIMLFFISFNTYSATPISGSIIENRAEVIYYDEAIQAYNKKYSNVVSLIVATVIDFELTPKELIIEKFRNENFTLFHQIENKSNTDISINFKIEQSDEGLFNITDRKQYIDENKNGIIDEGDTELKNEDISSINLDIDEVKNIIISGKTPNVVEFGDFSLLDITAEIPTIKKEVAKDKIIILAEAVLEIAGFADRNNAIQNEIVIFNFEAKNSSSANAIQKEIFIDSEINSYIVVESKIPANTQIESRESGNEDLFVYHIIGLPENSYTKTKPIDTTLIDKVAFLYEEFEISRQETGSYSVAINKNASISIETTYDIKYKNNIVTEDIKTSDDMIVLIPEIEPTFDNFNNNFSKIRSLISSGENINLMADISVCNLDSSTKDEYYVEINTKLSKDIENNFKIIETEINSGIFEVSSIPTRSALEYDVEENNNQIEVLRNEEIYITLKCNNIELKKTVYVDPLNVVFDSNTDQPVENIKVILKGVDDFGDTFTPNVYDLDGNAISNEQITDENGFYSFPNVDSGQYKIEIQENLDYSYPSSKPLSYFGDNRVLDPNGSFGKVFSSKLLGGNNIISMDIPLDPIVNNNIFIRKEADKSSASVGDIVEYTITITNLSSNTVNDLKLVDELPLGLDFLSSLKYSYEIDNNIITFNIEEISPSEEIEIKYRVLVKINATNGDGVNIAQAFTDDYTSNVAKHKLDIEQESIFENPLIMGKVFKDCNDNSIKDHDEVGIPGVKIYLNNGYYAITDKNGNYKFYNLKAKTYAIRIDQSSLPKPHDFKIINNRNAKDPLSAFADLKYGELHRRDFRDVSCSPQAMESIKNRIENLSDIKTEIEKSAEKELTFDQDSSNDLQTKEDSGLIDEDENNINKIYLNDINIVKTSLLPVISSQDVLLAKDVGFDSDKYNVELEYIESINEIIKKLKADNEMKILLVGHTDSSASIEYNQILSEKRSNAVRDIIVNGGINTDRIETRGDGELSLKEDNETEEADARNRRVEIYYRKTNIGLASVSLAGSPTIPLVEEKDSLNIINEEDQLSLINQIEEDKEIIDVETTINLEKYSEDINYNNTLSFIDLSDDDIVSKDQISIRIKGRSSGNLQLVVNNKVIPNTSIGQIVKFQEKDMKSIEYIAIKLESGVNILEVRVVDPFGNVRGTEVIKVFAVGKLENIIFNLPENNEIPADNSKAFPMLVTLTDKNGFKVNGKYVINLETSIGLWDVVDINESEAGIQATIENGEAIFDFIPPSEPEKGQIKARINDIEVKEDLFATTYLREMFAVGIVEGMLNFNKEGLSENISKTGLEDEVQSLELTDGVNGRISLFLKGRVKGDFLLTMAYDSDKDSSEKLYKDIEPDEFYPIYGDSSINGFEAQSTSKLFVKIAKNNSYMMYGDFNTKDYTEKNVNIGNYSRTLTGIKHVYQKNKITINYYIAEESFGSRVKEIESKGGFGPYNFSNGEEVAENSEKVTVITRDKNTGAVINESVKSRFSDYEINGFYDGIVFREPIPTVDEDFNPNFIKIEYETESDGEKYLVYGVKSSYALTKDLSVGVGYNTSREKDNEFSIKSTNLNYEKNGFKANIEIAESDNQGEKGTATKINIKYTNSEHSIDLRAETADDKFNNEYSSVTKGRTNVSLKTKNKITQILSVKNDIYYTKEDELVKETKSIKTTVETIINPNLRIENGVRYNHNESNSTVYESTMLTGKFTWQPDFLPELSTYAEYEQDVQVSEINRFEMGAEYALFEKGSIYLKQERLSNLISEIELSETETETTKTIVGTNYDLTKDTEVYSEYRIDEAISEADAEAAIGVRNRFKINEQWEGNLSFERVESIDGDNPSSTSVATTFQHNSGKDWKTTYRLQYSNTDATDFYLGSVGYVRKLNENYSMLLKDTVAYEEYESSWRNKFVSGFAYRDNLENELNLLFKYENDYLVENNLTDMTNKLSTQFNKQYNEDLNITGMYSIKHTHSEIENYNYAANWLASRVSYDINESYDIGLSGAYLFDNETVDNYVIGVEAGYLFQKNMWVSVGYNFEGLSDNKFSSDNYNAQGVYLRFRLKLTEENFKWLQ